jgi:hypothetical protein
MNTKTIDVLDIMRRDAVAASELLTAAKFRESSEARDAVAELISAISDLRRFCEGNELGTNSRILERKWCRVDVALTRVGGEA